LTAALGSDQAQLKPTLVFNRGCAQLAAGDSTAAEKTFLDVDASAADPSLRAAARYNLGQIACKQAEPMVEKDKAAAIETYRRAERHFRNALADQPGNADAARNIEVVQRKIAKLLDEQKKQEQQQKDPKDQQNKQDQKDQDKNNPDQQNKDQQKQDQDKKDQQKQDQQKKDPQQGQSGQDQKDQQNQQQQGKDGKKDEKPSKPEEQKDKKPEEGKDGKDQQDQQQQDPQGADQQPQANGKPQDHREFDVKAAQILDKEKKQRERLKQLLQLMRARAAPVEKDW
jgi:Ca-activated chloride channel family protein